MIKNYLSTEEQKAYYSIYNMVITFSHLKKMTNVDIIKYFSRCHHNPENEGEQSLGNKFYKAAALVCRRGLIDWNILLQKPECSDQFKEIFGTILQEFEF